MKLKQFIFALVAMLSGFAFTANAQVAKVGNTEYATIDEAISNWTNGSTLTLLADVTLSKTIELSSTEYHILDLGTYTMTAASRKDAIQIVNNGRSSASYALDIKADAKNPGGITASGKAVVKTTGKSGVKDRPIIRFYNGVFTGTNVVYHSGSNGTNCPQFWFYGGVFNGTVYANRALFQFYGGTFNGAIQISVDSSAYALVSGGRFKKLSNQYGSSLNSDKFTIGSAKGVFDRGIYVDAEGYYVITPALITEVSAKYPAVKKESYNSNSYFKYSAAATYGMFYEVASEAGTGSNVTVWEPVKAPAVEEIVKPEATEEEKAVVEEVIAEVTNNAAVKNNTVELPAEVVDFAIELAAVEVAEETTPEAPEAPVTVVTEISYTVTPSNAAGEKVSKPTEPITFRLPLPSNWASEKVKVIYNGTALDGDYTVMTDNGAKYVEVESQSFSTYTVQAIVPVAKIGEQKYATLAEAIAAAQTGDEIVIIANVELTETTEFPAGKTITLNLNNKKVSAADKNVVKNSGAALTIKNGTIERTGTVAGYAVNVVSGTLEVEDVTIVGGLYTSGTSLVATNTNISQASASRHAIYAYNCAVTINSGTYHNDNAGNAAVFAYGSSVVTINNGTFSIDNGKQTFGWTSCLIDANAGGKYVINGGEFKGHFRVQANSAMEINGGTFENTHGEAYAIYGTAVVKGGTFTDAAAQTFAKDNLAAGYELGTDGAVAERVVAKIGNVEYATLIAAIDAVKDGETITLIADETFTADNYSDNGGWRDGVAYSGDKSFTIDLNSHTIGQDGYLNDYLFWFKNAGSKENTITIKNGTLDAGTTAFCALCTANSHDNKLTVNTENVNLINNISNGSTVKIRAGSVYNAKTGTKITGKNSYLGIENWNATVNIYDGAEIYMNGTSSYNGCLVGVGGNGTVNVYGGYGKGVSGGLIAMTSGGTINVEGGEWIANTDGAFANSNKSVLIAQSDKQYNAGAGNAVVNVTGGTFKGGYNCYGNKAGDAQINISGGNFNADPSAYVKAGYVATEAAGIYTVVEAPAYIEGKASYVSLAAAYEAAVNGDVIVLNESVTTFPVINKAVTFKGGKENAAVEINVFLAQNFTAIDGTVRFENLTFNKPLFTEQGGTKPGLTIEFEGCNFNVPADQGYAILIGTSWSNSVVKGLKVNNCNFKYVGDVFKGGYMLYVQCVNEVTITNNTIDGNNLYRGAIHLGDATEHATVATVSNNTIKNFCRGVMMGNRVAGSSATISGNTFDNINYSDKDSKPAHECAPIFIHSNATASALQVALTNNKVENCANPMIYSEDTDLIKYYVTEFTGNTVGGSAVEFANSYNAPNQVFPVATINDAEYFTLQAAINAVKNGETIKFARDFTENVTVSQVANVSFVIDGQGKKFDGTITLDGNSRNPAAETLTIQNVNFETSTASRYFIDANDASADNRYSHNVTIKNCNFTATEGSAAVHTAAATRFRQAFNIKIEGGVFTNMHSVLQAYGVIGVEVSGVKTVNSKNGVSFGTSQNAVLKNVEFAGCVGYGVRADAEVNTTLTIEDANIDAFIPVVVRKATANYNVAFNGENTMTATNTDGIWCAVGASEYEANGTMPTDATGKVRVTLNDATLSKDGVYGDYVPVAKIGDVEYTSLQAAVNAVKNGETIKLILDIEENVTLTEKTGLYYTIDGDGKTMTGTITVSSLSDTEDNRRITIKNINFVDTVNARDFITSTTTNHYPRLTVEGCSFTGTGKEAANSVAIRLKSSHSVVIKNCTGAGLHSFLQNTSGWNLTIENVKVTDSKSGLALGTVQGVTVKGCEIAAAGYGIRMDAGYNNNAVLESNKVEAFIPVVVRKATVDSNITVKGENEFTASNTDGLWCAIGTSEYEANGEMPTAATGNVKVAVSSNLPQSGLYGNYVEGSLTAAYTSADGYWGECGGNANYSFELKFYNDDTFMGSTSLNDVDNIIDGDVYVSWNIKLGANTDNYWTMSWTVAPTVAMQPNRVEQWIDGVKVAECGIQANGPDDLNPIIAAVADADGVIKSFATSFDAAVAAAQAGETVAILKAGTYALKVKNNVTITGAVAGVEFANIGALGCNGANVTFNNVTFTYAENSLYKGLQHSGDLVYNNCIFNGQVFLYGQSETFNGCTFNTTDSANYNVWTYGAKNVAFNECTFNSAGKSVLIYAESASVTNNVTVSNSQFIATQAVDGKAAIEMDSSLSGAISLTIDNATTATGFAAGNVSGNSLWNNKKGNSNDANNDITVQVGDEVVLAPIYEAVIAGVGYRTLQEAINAAVLMTGDVTVEIMAGTYAQDINLTNTAITTGNVNVRPNITFKAVEGQEVVLAGTVTLGYRQQNVGASMWNGKVTFNGITFDHAENGKHSLDIQDVKGIALVNCKVIGDGEYGIGSNGGNATTDAVFTSCTFENGSMQVLGQLGANLVVDNSICNDFSFNVQGGAAPGMTIKNTTFNMTLTDAHVGESFYVVRTNASPINIEDIKLNVDSEVSAVAADQAKWGIFWARKDADAKWNIAGCEVNLTEAAMAQTELLLTKNDATTYEKAKDRIIVTNLTSTSNSVADLIARTEGCATVNGVGYKDGKLDTVGMVAVIGNKVYPSLAEAVAAAKSGATITLVDNVNVGNITIEKGLTLDGAGYTITGHIHANLSNVKMTVKNVNFNGDNATYDYAIRVDRANHFTAENCTADGYKYSFLYANKSNNNFTIKDVTVTNCANYGVYFASFNNATIENLTVIGAEYGVAAGNAANSKVNIKNSTFDVELPLYIQDKGTGKVAFTFEGVNNMGDEIVYLSEYVKLASAVQVGTTVYGTFAEAFAAAQDGETVKLLSDFNLGLNDVVVNNAGQKVLANVDGKNITFDMNGKKITVDHRSTEAADRIYSVICVEDGAGLTVKGNGSIDVTTGVADANVMPKVAYMFWKRGTTGYLVIEDGNYHMDNSEDSMVYTNGGNIVTVKGGTFILDAVGTRNNGFPWVFNVAGNDAASLNVTGGIYNYDIRKQFWAQEVKLADGLTMRNNGDGTWTVVDAVASIVGGESYGSIQEAIDAAQDGETVQLLVDVAYTDADALSVEEKPYSTMLYVQGKNITLDLNGKNIDVEYTGSLLYSVVLVSDGAGLTVTGEGSINARGLNAEGAAAKNIAYMFWKRGETGYLVIENGTFHLNDAADSMVYTNGDQIVTINGGTFILDAVASQTNGFPVIFSTSGNNDRQIIVNGGTFNYDINHQIRPFEPYVAPEKAVKKVNDMWTIVPAEAYVTEMLGGWVNEAGAREHKVGYATVAEAIAATNNLGNTVTILAGEYTANFNVNKGITVQGAVDAEGNNLVNITGEVNISADGVTVKNLNIKNTKTGNYDCAIYVNAKDIVIDGVNLDAYNAMRNCYTYGNVTIKNSVISGSKYAVHFDGYEGGVIAIENSTITGWCAYAGKLASVTYTNSTLNKGNSSGQRFYNQIVNFNECTFGEGIKLDFAGSKMNVAFNDADLTVDGVKALMNKDSYITSHNVTLNGNKVVYAASYSTHYYNTLQAAIDAVPAGGTATYYVKLRSDNVLTAPVVVPADKKIAIDLNGFNITYTSDVAGEAMITNNGELTIENNGNVVYTYNGAADASYSKGNYTIANVGKLTIDGGVIANATAVMKHASYAIDNRANGEVVINKGEVINTNNYAIRQFASGNNENSVVVNGGKVSGTRAVWMQAAGSNTADAPAIELYVRGGELIATGETGYKLAVYSYNYGNSMENVYINIAGGNIDGDIALTGGVNKAVAETVVVTGGTITNIYSYADNAVADKAINIGEDCDATFLNKLDETYLAWGYQMKGDAAPYTVEYTGRREVVTIVDGEVTEFDNENDIEVGTLTYKRNVGTTWTPLYVPFEVPAEMLLSAGFEVGYITGVREADKNNDGEIDNIAMEIIQIKNSRAVLHANHPYFVRSNDQRKLLQVVLEDATLYSSDENTYDCRTMFTEYSITGNLSLRAGFTANDRGISAGNWEPFVDEYETLNPFRFYLTITPRGNSPFDVLAVKSMSVVVRGEENEDGTTTIYEVNAENGEEMIFDLSGRRVLETEKGIYIKNGKKIYVK